MKADIYNQQNQKIGEADLLNKIFNIKWNPDLVHQVLTVQLANRRQVLAHTKGRGEVRGGGRKPWRQKGTGRARHGSIRSPIWKGGGITFGPTKERVFARKINKKMKIVILTGLIGCLFFLSCKKDKNEKLRRKAIAAAGEYLFYAATQM